MNVFERFMRMWWSLRASMLGLGAGLRPELHPAAVPPTVSAEALLADATAHGAADARAESADPWLFGGPGDERSEVFDPDYVRALRRRRDAAVASLRAVQRSTDDLLKPARRRRDEALDRMVAARRQMADLGAYDARREALERAFHGPREAAAAELAAVELQGDTALGEVDGMGVDAAEETAAADTGGPAGANGAMGTTAAADRRQREPWEGGSQPLALPWRLLILAGLVAAELPVQFYVFFDLLGRVPGQAGLARWLALATGALVVFGPFLAGSMLRMRTATGADPRTLPGLLVLAASWLCTIAVLGLVRGRVFAGGSAPTGPGHVTPTTIIVMFIALLVLIGAMAFILGLARRHPIEQAFNRHRNRAEEYEALIRATAVRLNPHYVNSETGAVNPAPGAPGETDGADGNADHAGGADVDGGAEGNPQELAVIRAFAAAEAAYFDALATTRDDPAFTEAVRHRRGLGGGEP